MWKFKFILFFSTFLVERLWAEEAHIHEKNESVMLGDMILTPHQYQFLFTNDGYKRHGLVRAFTHWPKAQVPFLFDPRLDPMLAIDTITAMQYIANVSCVEFYEHDGSARDHVYITRGDGCSSQVGNLRRGRQTLKLSKYCMMGNIIHELLHSLGFLHMHTAPQRDEFVKIIYKNVVPSALKNFEKYTAYVSMFNTQYDYRSIMHYRKEAFAIDPTIPTIVPKEPVADMGQRREMSEGDITRLNRMYKCPDFLEAEYFDQLTSKGRGKSLTGNLDHLKKKLSKTQNDLPSSLKITGKSTENKEKLELVKTLGKIIFGVMNMTHPLMNFIEKKW